jgi:hypothetical protein
MHMDTVILFRGLERLLICLFAGVSLVLGWDLFRRGLEVDQRAELSLKDFKVRLQRVGPGVFFALFGAVVLAVALRAPVAIPVSGDAPASTKGEKAGFPEAQHADREKAGASRAEFRWAGESTYWLNLTQVLNALLGLQAGGSVTQPQARASRSLERFRDDIVAGQFGSDKVARYKEVIDRYAANPGNVPGDDRKLVEDLQPWMEYTPGLGKGVK